MNKQLWEEIDRIIVGMNFYMPVFRWFAVDYTVDDDGIIDYVFMLVDAKGNEYFIFSDDDQKSFVNRLTDYCAGFEAGRKSTF